MSSSTLKHPHRKRAVVYFFIPILFIAIFFIAGIYGAHLPNQDLYKSHILGTISGVALMYAFIFIVPFFMYAFKYWRLKVNPSALPPADSQPHDLTMQFTDNFFAPIFGNIFSRIGDMHWVNSEKRIKLFHEKNGNITTYFDVPFKDVQLFEVDIYMLIIKVAGKTYTCFPYNTAIAVSTAVGAAADSQLGTIILGNDAIDQAGIPLLAEYLRAEGVKVIISDIRRSIELGFDWGLVVLMVGAIFVIGFLVQ